MNTYQAEKLKVYIEARLDAYNSHNLTDVEHKIAHEYALMTWEDFLKAIINDK
jgi:hypothetical protein